MALGDPRNGQALPGQPAPPRRVPGDGPPGQAPQGRGLASASEDAREKGSRGWSLSPHRAAGRCWEGTRASAGHRADAQPREGPGLAPAPVTASSSSGSLPRSAPLSTPGVIASAQVPETMLVRAGGSRGRPGRPVLTWLFVAGAQPPLNQYQFTVKHRGRRPRNESPLCSPASNEPVREGLSKLSKRASRHQGSSLHASNPREEEQRPLLPPTPAATPRPGAWQHRPARPQLWEGRKQTLGVMGRRPRHARGAHR